jgi:hypothetical protein
MTEHGPAGFQVARESDTFIDHVGPILFRPNEKSVTLYLRIERRHTTPAGSAHGVSVGRGRYRRWADFPIGRRGS